MTAPGEINKLLIALFGLIHAKRAAISQMEFGSIKQHLGTGVNISNVSNTATAQHWFVSVGCN